MNLPNGETRSGGHPAPRFSDINFDLPPEGISLETLEKQIIFKAIERSKGNISRAARLLKTTHRVLENRVKKFGIQRMNLPNGEANRPSGEADQPNGEADQPSGEANRPNGEI
ncbi:MAG: helix-turn-helix domain-containing protein [Pseudomonadota bacterium]